MVVHDLWYLIATISFGSMSSIAVDVKWTGSLAY